MTERPQMPDRAIMLRQYAAEQFAAFDVQLYLDTHPNDRSALDLFDKYQKNAQKYKKEFEGMYGPLSSDSAMYGSWRWVEEPWPWEREFN